MRPHVTPLRPTRSREGSEAELHVNICNYIRMQYPHVVFHTDFAAGMKMTKGQAVKNRQLQSGRAWPDLFIPEPRGGMPGFFVELKRGGVKVYLKDGVTLVAEEHIREQAAVIEELKKRGYAATFAIGFDESKKVIDEYLSQA